MSHRSRLLSLIAGLIFLIASLHLAATLFSLYWTLWWFDIILHLLGGIFAGLLVLWLRFFSGYIGTSPVPPGKKLIPLVVLGVVGIGVGWEVFERLLGHTWSVEGYWLDTTVDIVLDLLGGMLALGYFTRRFITHE